MIKIHINVEVVKEESEQLDPNYFLVLRKDIRAALITVAEKHSKIVIKYTTSEDSNTSLL